MESKSAGKQNRHLPAFLLLFLLDGDAHGGALWNRMEKITPPEWKIDSGAIYRALRDLEENEAVTSYWDTTEAGPAKRIYQLTEKGKIELDGWFRDIVIRKRNLDYFITQYEQKRGGDT